MLKEAKCKLSELEPGDIFYFPGEDYKRYDMNTYVVTDHRNFNFIVLRIEDCSLLYITWDPTVIKIDGYLTYITEDNDVC